jgi:hypothetical protein
MTLLNTQLYFQYKRCLYFDEAYIYIIRFMVGRISTLNFRVCNYKILILHFLNQTYIAHHNFKRFHISLLDNHTCGPENST